MNTLASLPVVGALVGVVLFLAERWRRRRAEKRAAAEADKRRQAEGERDDAKLRETVNVAAEARKAEAAHEGAKVPAGVAAAHPRTPEETIKAADAVRRKLKAEAERRRR